MTHDECIYHLERIQVTSRVLRNMIEVLSIAEELSVTQYDNDDLVTPQRTLTRLKLLVEMTITYLDTESEELTASVEKLIEGIRELNTVNLCDRSKASAVGTKLVC